MKIFILFFTLTVLIGQTWANETCSRVAVINYQEVLVDASSSNKGEGLRFYLEKDPIAVELLNEYQEKNKPTMVGATTSTVGSLMVASGILNVNSGDHENVFNNNNMIIGGVIVMGLSYLSSITVQYKNEEILKRSIEQYNKRNTPKIYFSPYKDNSNNTGLGIGIQQEF